MTDDAQTDETQTEPQPQNREQRRAQKFHRKTAGRQDNLLTQRANNTGFLASPAATLADGPNDALAAIPAEGSTHHGGPGTGGETESDEGMPHHEGMHLGNQGNS